MKLNRPSQLSAQIVPLAQPRDFEAAMRLDLSHLVAGDRRAVVVLDCTSIRPFDATILEDLLALRRHLKLQGIRTIMVAIRQPTRFGQAITRLIPASLDILVAQLPRFVGVAARAR